MARWLRLLPLLALVTGCLPTELLDSGNTTTPERETLGGTVGFFAPPALPPFNSKPGRRFSIRVVNVPSMAPSTVKRIPTIQTTW